MRKAAGWVCALAFLALCMGLVVFLHAFTRSESPFTYLVWESACVVAPDGTEQPFDPARQPPALEEGEFYRFSATMPDQRNEENWLIFEVTGLEAAVFLDGEELWYSASVPAEHSINLGQLRLPLPPGGGETLTMDVRLLSEEVGLFPPLARFSTDPTDQRGTIAYANLYGIPAGASALALILLWGLFLLGLATGKRDWLLLLPVLAAAALTVSRISIGYGDYFLPQALQQVFSGQWTGVLAAAALLLYLVLHRQRIFWRALGIVTAWSAGALAVWTFLSWLQDGHLYRYLSSAFTALFQRGFYDGLLYWLTLWLVLVSAFLSAWELTQSIARAQAETQSLTLRNQLILDNYQALSRKMREGAALRHEFSHRLIAMDSLLQAGDLAGLKRCLALWRAENSSASPLSFTENMAVNIILQDAAGRASASGINFQASAPVPGDLPIPDEDLCTLLMNLLDNALEAAARTPEGSQKFIRFKMKSTGGILTIQSENSFDGHVETDSRGQLRTTKADPESHGFGLTQMRAVIKKYRGTLDLHYAKLLFTVRITLKLPGHG